MYVLFFERYPPRRYQAERVLKLPGLSGVVVGFDHYLFIDPDRAYSELAHGVFLFAGSEETPAPPEVSIRYPDGKTAYKIAVK